MTQLLRRSQFITTYGPGAIMEGSKGPRIIPTLALSGLFTNRRPSDFEITDLRLSGALLKGAGILRLPSNAELGEPDAKTIYDTISFPRWALCVKHERLYYKRSGDNYACPRCPPHPNRYEAWDQVHRQAIRFVRACEAGHLDEVDWIRLINHSRGDCNPGYLRWEGGGGALRHIDIICPNCEERINLGLAYARTWHCSGRFPEEGPAAPGCSYPAKIIQRGAANLRLAELQTALTIPPRSTNLHRLLEMLTVQTALLAAQPQNKQELIRALQPLVQRGYLLPSILAEISSYAEPVLLSAMADSLAGSFPTNLRDLRLEEFAALRHAAAHGYPPQPSSAPGGSPQFEVIPSQVRVIIGPGGYRLRVTPVNRLRVVMVQTGYRRLEPTNLLVDRVYNDGQHLWYPGVELFGEGIFLDLDPRDHPDAPAEHFPLQGPEKNAWMDAWENPGRFEQNIQPEERDQLHPVFVWWHTLAHRLVNALAVDSGYSSASVRERVFVQTDPLTGTAGGGVLLYTSQPGGDGTLGGMVALVPEFERVLASALDTIDACSNDPLCGQERFGPAKYNGAACYTCALISETSCEHRNMRLDRSVLLRNLP